MAQQSRALEQIEDLMREAAMRILALPKDESYAIRFPYGSGFETGSAPGFEREDNVCCIYNVPIGDDAYGQQSHVSYRDDGMPKLTQVNEYTEVHQINFACYGPASFDWARKLRAGLVRQDIKEFLYHSRFFLVPGSQRVTDTPELVGGEWWRRSDMSARFYEYVRLEEENSVGVIETVHIKPITERRS